MRAKLIGCCLVLVLMASPAARAAAPDGRFKTVAGGVNDQVTGLTWKVPTNGMTYQWSSAQAVCASPWRLPTIQELLTLYDYGSSSGMDPAFTAAGYWTSSLSSAAQNLAWLIFFGSGADIKSTTLQLQALCVQ